MPEDGVSPPFFKVLKQKSKVLEQFVSFLPFLGKITTFYYQWIWLWQYPRFRYANGFRADGLLYIFAFLVLLTWAVLPSFSIVGFGSTGLPPSIEERPSIPQLRCPLMGHVRLSLMWLMNCSPSWRLPGLLRYFLPQVDYVLKLLRVRTSGHTPPSKCVSRIPGLKSIEDQIGI